MTPRPRHLSRSLVCLALATLLVAGLCACSSDRDLPGGDPAVAGGGG